MLQGCETRASYAFMQIAMTKCVCMCVYVCVCAHEVKIE